MQENIDSLLLQVSEERRKQVEDSERNLLMDVLPRLAKMEEDVAVMRDDVKYRLREVTEYDDSTTKEIENELIAVNDRISLTDNNMRMICEEVVGIAELLKERSQLQQVAADVSTPPNSVMDSHLSILSNEVGPYALPDHSTVEKPASPAREVATIATQTPSHSVGHTQTEPSLVYSRIEKEISTRAPQSILRTPSPTRSDPRISIFTSTGLDRVPVAEYTSGSQSSYYGNLNNNYSVDTPPVRSPKPSPTYIGRSIPTAGVPQQFSVKVAFQGSPVPTHPQYRYR